MFTYKDDAMGEPGFGLVNLVSIHLLIFLVFFINKCFYEAEKDEINAVVFRVAFYIAWTALCTYYKDHLSRKTTWVKRQPFQNIDHLLVKFTSCVIL